MCATSPRHLFYGNKNDFEKFHFFMMKNIFSKSESRNLKKIQYPFDDLRIWAFEKIPCFKKRRTRPIIFRDLEPWEFVHIHTTYQDHTGEQFSGPWTDSHGSIKNYLDILVLAPAPFDDPSRISEFGLLSKYVFNPLNPENVKKNTCFGCKFLNTES